MLRGGRCPRSPRRRAISDFELINPLGEVLTREAILGGVGAGAVDFLSDTVTSRIKVRLHGNTAGQGNLQFVWEQTGAIGPLPLPS